MNEQFQTIDQIKSTALDMLLKFGPKFLVATAIMVAGHFTGRWLGCMFEQLLVRVAYLIVLVLFAIMALQNLGVELLPLIAGLGVAGAGIALATIDEILRANARVLQEPTPVVGVQQLAESSVTLCVSPWVAVPDYVAASGEVNKAILEAFRAKGISIPMPQHEVRMLGNTTP